MVSNQKCCCSSNRPDCCTENCIESFHLENWMVGTYQTHIGEIPLIKAELNYSDKLAAWRVRWGINRMKFSINPGLYALGQPDKSSPVLVTANYKLSFDKLRQELNEQSVWILVLDTKGINVWCAAGKGTFGTEELIQRIKTVNLESIVAHRKIILPQLGAPGVAAHEVEKKTGFKIIYGPVRAADLKNFFEAGLKASKEMRKVKFSLRDRLVLIPIEIKIALFPILIFLAIVFGLNLLARREVYKTISDLLGIMGVFLAGGALVPLLLPFIPVRSFALKGWILGFVISFSISYLTRITGMELIANLFLLSPVSAFLGLNFTGSSTYTSLSGVLKEMKYATPLMLFSFVLGIIMKLIILF